ncbi:MAG: NAD-dependent epimerase/dehydratase family protein [Anaerolineae bacterium]|nr:NAD-dependent epimerase/dehydratase family protein [Anaerolineae bacterium]NIN94128.1 NAD-dependent epimerase/dehydratase family protein [Anaerolineae bacterium]NIQ77175.1 NAD-dependent epimerase/dehydratase family protein [Anaerolineae bacterium]
MNVLVTGGAGFIGSHVVDALIEEGHSVVVIDDLSSGKRGHVHHDAKFRQLDIRSPDLEGVFAEERPEVVNHHAAQVDVRVSMADPIFDADVNVLGSLNLLECARRHGVEKLIYASTGGAVYGQPAYLPCDEVHPVEPICPYGISKLAVEHYLYLYRQTHGLEYTTLRYANVYGPRQDPFGEGGVVAIFARQMVEGEQVVINGSGEQERDFVYVDDVVRANLVAMERGNGGTYNLGRGVGTSINELFATMQQMTGYADEAVHGPPKPGETFKIYLDAGKARAELEWESAVTLEEGLERTIEHFRGAS